MWLLLQLCLPLKPRRVSAFLCGKGLNAGSQDAGLRLLPVCAAQPCTAGAPPESRALTEPQERTTY